MIQQKPKSCYLSKWKKCPNTCENWNTFILPWIHDQEAHSTASETYHRIVNHHPRCPNSFTFPFFDKFIDADYFQR